MNNTKANVVSRITIDEIVKLKKCGLTYREISSMCGVSKQWINYLVKRNSLNNQILILKKESICLLKRKKFESKLSIEEYAIKLGLSTYMTRKILTTNYNKIRKSKLTKVAMYLECNPEDLIEKDINTYKFLPEGVNDLENIYNSIAYKNIKNNISYNYKGKDIDGRINISKKTVDIIKAYRITKGYSMSDFSKITNISLGRLSQMENGQCLKLKYSSLKKIANALNINAEQLLIGDIGIDLDIDNIDIKIKIDKNISKKIKKNRLLLKISQFELGERCGGNQSLISRIELGTVKTVKKSILKNIYKELNLSYDSLVG